MGDESSDQHQRLYKALAATGLSLRDISSKIGYSQQYISDVKRGRYPISEKFLMKLETVFGFSSDWVRTGEGDMWVPGGGRERFDREISAAGEHSPAQGAGRPAYGRPASAPTGLPVWSAPPDSLAETIGEPHSDYSVDPRLWGPNRYVLRVEDDAMWPALMPGDLVLVEQQRSPRPEALNGRIVVVRLGEDALIRRLRTAPNQTTGEMRVWLHSESESREPVDVTKRLDFRILGVVLYLVERHL